MSACRGVEPGPLTTTLWAVEHARHGTSWDAREALVKMRDLGYAYGWSTWVAACAEALDASWGWQHDKARRMCRDVAILMREMCLHAVPAVLVSHVHCPNT